MTKDQVRSTEEALKLALEPVGTYGEIYESMHSLLRSGLQRDQQIYMAMKDKPLYATPPAAQRQWVHATPWRGLTDVEWMNIVNKNQAWFGMQPDEVAHEVCKLTEAKLKEKNS